MLLLLLLLWVRGTAGDRNYIDCDRAGREDGRWLHGCGDAMGRMGSRIRRASMLLMLLLLSRRDGNIVPRSMCD